MLFKQSTLDEILTSEKEMIESGFDRYNDYYQNASDVIEVFRNGMIQSICPSCSIFCRFFSQVDKHLVLALFSTLRLHSAQCTMNLRHVLEAGTWAAYALAHKNLGDFINSDIDSDIDFQRLGKERYNWLESNFSDDVKNIKVLKELLNKFFTHSNILSANQTCRNNTKAEAFETQFFDYENEKTVKCELVLIAKSAISIMGLLYKVNQKYEGFKIQDEWETKYCDLDSKIEISRDHVT